MGDVLKIKVNNFKTKFPKVFKLLTDGLPRKEREIAAGTEAIRSKSM
jgi:hypothetical protein